MTRASLRFLAAAGVSAALIGCGPPPAPAPAPVEPTTAPLTVPAFTPDVFPEATTETTVLPGPNTGAKAPKTGAAAPVVPATVPEAAPKAPAITLVGAKTTLVDPRLLVNGMAFGFVMRPKQTYDIPAFNTNEMRALLQPPAHSFDANGINDARKVSKVTAVATLDLQGMLPSFVSVIEIVDKAAADELVEGPIRSKMRPAMVGERTIYVSQPVVLPTPPTEVQKEETPAAPDAPAKPAEAAPQCGDDEVQVAQADPLEAAPQQNPPVLAEHETALWRVDDVTFVLAPRPQLEALMKSYDAGVKADDELIALLSATDPQADVAAVFLTDPLKDFLTTAAQQLPPMPGPFKDVAELPNLVNSATLTVSISPEPKLSFAVRSPDAASAKRVQALLDAGLGELKPMWGFGKQALVAQTPNEKLRPALTWGVGLVDKLLKGTKVTQVDEVAVLELGGLGPLDALIAEGAPHLRLAADEMRKAADVQIAMNNLKQLALAFHIHHDGFRTLPAAAVCDKDGKPLLSWRVAILPLIDQGELAKQFHLDEPWDSEHNKALIQQMPAVFKSPGVVVEAGKTLYLLPTGPEMLFDGAKKPNFADVKDGLSNTILIVEANPEHAVTWTKPDDLPINLNSLPVLGRARDVGFLAAFMDGSVRMSPKGISAAELQAYLTPSGGEALPAGVPPANVQPEPVPPKPTTEAAPPAAPKPE